MTQLINKFTSVALCATLFSFSAPPGVDSYTIYLGDKRVVHQYVTRESVTPDLSLEQNDAGSSLLVYYSHCGKIGTSRTLTLKDENRKVLKEWRYDDTLTEHTPMTVKVKDISALQPRQVGGKISLFYSSRELTEGRLLVSIAITKTAVASK